MTVLIKAIIKMIHNKLINPTGLLCCPLSPCFTPITTLKALTRISVLVAASSQFPALGHTDHGSNSADRQTSYLPPGQLPRSYLGKLNFNLSCIKQSLIQGPQSSGAMSKSRWTSWAPVPNKPTVSVDVKQHFNQSSTQSSEAV